MFARYLLRHQDQDPQWQAHVRSIITWVEGHFGVADSGATTIAEQDAFWHPMGSHTARYASVNALLYAATGDQTARDKAYRAFNWATYMARPDGVVIDGPTVNNQWFSDGYGDYVRHFMVGLSAVPEWAPPGQDHITGSTSIVRQVSYAAGAVSWTTADAAATESLRVASAPTGVTAGGQPLAARSDLTQEGWTYDAATGVLRVRHDHAGSVSVTLGGTPPTTTTTTSSARPRPRRPPRTTSTTTTATTAPTTTTTTTAPTHETHRPRARRPRPRRRPGRRAGRCRRRGSTATSAPWAGPARRARRAARSPSPAGARTSGARPTSSTSRAGP